MEGATEEDLVRGVDAAWVVFDATGVDPCQKVEKVKVGKKLQSRIEEFIKEFTDCCNLSCC